MKKRVVRYLKHIIVTALIAIPIVIAIGFMSGNVVKFDRNELAATLENEGPYVFIEEDSTVEINYIKGSRKEGYYLDTFTESMASFPELTCYYPLDSSSFSFDLIPNFAVPKSQYQDDGKILAISDIESNYATFRNFLINNKVIDKDLNWVFGKNHLVLVGDFIDRSYFTTQVLWFIYKLEQDAKKKRGMVHYILGNHEIMNMQGNHSYAKSKYNKIATILGKQQFELYSKNSFLGRWLESKNTIEVINGVLFVHGGISPELADLSLDLDSLNQIIRRAYYTPYYPKKGGNDVIEALTSAQTSPYWYRGYFDESLPQEIVERGLDKFDTKAVVVGHTLQEKINRQYDGKVIGIDVEHPQDYYEYFAERKSEGLLIDDGRYFRVLHDGERRELK